MKETILQSWSNMLWPDVRSTKPSETGAGVLDQRTFNTIEVDELFDTVNHATTTIGQAVLFRSITCPLDSIQEIQARQQALTELKENPVLREQIEEVVKYAKVDEKGLYQLLFGNFLGMFGTSRENVQVEGYGYAPYIKGTRFFLELVNSINSIKTPNSSYLNSIFDSIKKFSDTRAFSLMQGPVYKTEQSLQCKKDRNIWSPALIFRPRLFKPLFLILIVTLFWLVAELNPLQSVDTQSVDSAFLLSPAFILFTMPLALFYIPLIGSYDRDSCILPLRNEFKADPNIQQTLDALGQLDELLSFIKFSENFGSSMILPDLIEADHYSIKLNHAKNPILGFQNEDYVGNDFGLDQEKLVFITGPNSGGKTAFCKTVTQIQLLTQIGCYVPVNSASLTIADRIFYQVPEISHLDDGEGRFGTELKRTKDVFLASSEKSLVVLDELSEGTTYEEKLETSGNILDGFFRKGNGTILITHNHQLVDNFVNKDIGLPRQVEFAHDVPTYKLIPGISRVSHADRVAKKIGFSKQDIDDYFSKK